MLTVRVLHVASKSLVGILVSAWLVVTAILAGRGHRLFWNDLAASAVVILAALMPTNARRAQFVSWATAIVGIWLVISPWMLGEESTDLVTWSCISSGFIIGGFEIVRLSSKSYRRSRTFRS
jgi:hypothetical protein